MQKRTRIIQREDVSVLRPKKLKKFNLKEFLSFSKKLEEAISKEESEKRFQIGDTSASFPNVA